MILVIKQWKYELHLFLCNATVDAHNTNIYNSTPTEKVEKLLMQRLESIQVKSKRAFIIA